MSVNTFPDNKASLKDKVNCYRNRHINKIISTMVKVVGSLPLENNALKLMTSQQWMAK